MCNFLYQSWLMILEWHTRIENLDYIKDILQNIPFIIATILIALLFQFLTYVDKDENKDLINSVVKKKISKIISFKELTFAFILALILPGYLEYNYFILSILVLSLYVWIIIFLLSQSFSIWNYMTMLDVRESVFKKLLTGLSVKDKDFVDIWRIIWNQKDSENIRDSESFEIWKSSLDKYFQNEKIIEGRSNIIAVSIDEFSNHLEKRNFVFFRKDGYIEWLLETHYQMWEKSYSLIDKEDLYLWNQSTDIFDSLNNLVHKTLEIMINQNSSHALHNKVDIHIEKYKNEVIGDKGYRYLEQWKQYFTTIFDSSGIRKNHNLWQGNSIPKSWKINSKTYDNSYVQQIISQFYWDWMFNTYLQSTEDSIIWSLNEVSEKLFPHTSSYLFARLLHLCIYQSSGMDIVVKEKLKFGTIGGGSLFTGDLAEDEKLEEERREETYALLSKILGRTYYTSSNIDKWMKELDEILLHNQDEKYKRKIEFWKKDLEGFKQYLDRHMIT